MADVVTFKTKDSKFEISVKGEFLTQCPNPGNFDHVELITKFRIPEYFHNPSGPAIVRAKDGKTEYFINGKILTPEERKRMEHNVGFSEKLHDELK